MALTVQGQTRQQYSWCWDKVPYRKFRKCPEFLGTIKADLTYLTGTLHHRWNLDCQEFKDAQQLQIQTRPLRSKHDRDRNAGRGAGHGSHP